MATFTSVGDQVTLDISEPANLLISISGTYNMTIALQREVGSPGSGVWSTVRDYKIPNATVSDSYPFTLNTRERFRLIVVVDTSGTATATLTSNALLVPTDTGLWGNISGTLANQTDLQSALDDKVDTDDLGALALLDTVGEDQIDSAAITNAKIGDGEISKTKLASGVFETSAGVAAGTAEDEAINAAMLRYFAGLYWPVDSRSSGANFTEITNTRAGNFIKTDRNMTLDNAFVAQQMFMLYNVATAPITVTVEAGAGGTGTLNSATTMSLGPSGLALVVIESNAGDEPQGFAFGDIIAPVVLSYAISDETTDLTTGNAKISFRMPFAMYLTAVRASVATAPTGATLIFNLKEAGTTVLSTLLSIDASELTSTTAASAAVISDPNLANDVLMTVDIDQIGSVVAGAGAKITLYGWRV